MLHKFDREALEAIERAMDEARVLRDERAGVRHLLLALIKDEGGTAARVLSTLGLPPDKLRRAILEDARQVRESPGDALASLGRGKNRPAPIPSRRGPEPQDTPRAWERFYPAWGPELEGRAEDSAADTTRDRMRERKDSRPPNLRYFDDPVREWDRELEEIESDARLARRLLAWILLARRNATSAESRPLEPQGKPGDEDVDTFVPPTGEQAIRILDAMSDLLPAYTKPLAAVCLRYFRGRSKEDIRTLLNVTDSEVQQLLQKGLKLLEGRTGKK